MNGDIIGLFHNRTNKPALYSHAVLLGDGSQEVSCSGDGSESNNKVQIFYSKYKYFLFKIFLFAYMLYNNGFLVAY